MQFGQVYSRSTSVDRHISIAALLTMLIVGGCATSQNQEISHHRPETSDTTGLTTDGKKEAFEGLDRESPSYVAEPSVRQIRQASCQDQSTPDIDEPALPSHGEVAEETALSLEDLENMAMANNPTLVQAAAQVRAARGAAYQAGLYPNPVMGYTGEQIGVNGTPGETQGGFIAQEFVTGGKLQLSRAKWSQRVRIAETQLLAQQHRVLNDVRVQFYRTLSAQLLVDIYRELLANGEDNLQTHREMLNLGQTNESGFLQAEVDLQRDRLNLKQAENEFQHAWQTLVALVGVPGVASGTLDGKLEPEEEPLEWDSALSKLLSTSPELRAACQKIRHDQITVERERVEPIPNLLTDITVGRNYESLGTTTTVNIGIPLPIFDRNQGTVQQAQSDLTKSHAEARRLELELRTRLADQYLDYQTAWQRIQDYEKTILPKARRSYELMHASYKSRRAAWPDVLKAQRIYLLLVSEHIKNLSMYRESDVAIRGMLLTGGLDVPPSPVGGGHIDAVPKPR